MTEGEAAGFLRLHPDTLKARRLRGEAPPYVDLCLGGRKPVIRYRSSDLERWVEQKLVQGPN